MEELGGIEIFRRYGSRSKNSGYQLSASGVPKRNAKLVKQKLAAIAKASASPTRPPRNEDGLCTDSVKYWKQHAALDPFIQAYVQFAEQSKLCRFFKQLDATQIYPKYRALVRTGRTSCSAPNLQQLPRDARFREMIVAPPGYWLLQIDYSVLELRTLAQICLKRYGRSTMADLFRQGIDLHRYTASQFLGMTLEQFEQLPNNEQKKARQNAKAIGFGTPGGLGAASLVSFAKQAHGVAMTLEEAKAFRLQLINKIYPEIGWYLKDTALADLAANLGTTANKARQAFPTREQRLHASRIVAGCTETEGGDSYDDSLIGHVWLCLQQLNCNPDLQRDITSQHPSSLLMRKIFYGHAVTLSGRIRGHIGFSQKANTPFQGLAADGNKLALFRLLRAGFQVVAFIHDEMLILIPDGVDYAAEMNRVETLLIEAMGEFCPDVPIACEAFLADCWFKGDAEQPISPQGKLLPYRTPKNLNGVPAPQANRAKAWERSELPANHIPF